MSQRVVNVQNVSKKFKIYHSPAYRIAEWITKKKYHEEFWALKNITFSLDKGKSIGIIGPNGAGKSTLLKILSGTLYPTTGNFNINGKVVSLLELGTGFHPELTGIENIYNSGRLLKYSDDYIKKKMDKILDFAGIGDFVYQPVKTYSSGMFVRLAFSLFANIEPDVYIVDEALSVGDILFQQKCFSFMEELKSRGTAIIVVSHDMQTVLKFCDKVNIMQNGSFIHSGYPVDMVNLYYAMMGEEVNSRNGNLLEKAGRLDEILGIKQKLYVPVNSQNNLKQVNGLRRGNKKVEIIGIDILDTNHNSVRTVKTGDEVYLDLYAQVKEKMDNLTFGFQITDRMNNVIFGLNSYMKTKKNICCSQGDIVKARFSIKVNLFQGLYTFAVAASDCNLDIAGEIYDFIEGCLILEVIKPDWRNFHGQAELPTEFELFLSEKS